MNKSSIGVFYGNSLNTTFFRDISYIKFVLNTNKIFASFFKYYDFCNIN